MEKKYNEFVGVSDVYIASVEDLSTGYTGGTPEILAPVATITNTPNVSSKNTYYSNKPANSYVSEGATEVKIVIPNLPAKLMAKVLGKHFDEATGRMYDDGTPNPPYFALGFKLNVGLNNYRYYWYLKGTFMGGAEEAETQTDAINEKQYELTFTALATTYAFTLEDESTASLKRVMADDTDEAFAGGSTWFSAVQTPSTATPPSALAISTIVPADQAEAILATADVVITFNNKIASGTVFLTGADNAVFATTSSYDATGKILTIKHTTNFATGVKYQVNIVGMLDIYGQTLATTTKTFTVA